MRTSIIRAGSAGRAGHRRRGRGRGKNAADRQGPRCRGIEGIERNGRAGGNGEEPWTTASAPIDRAPGSEGPGEPLSALARHDVALTGSLASGSSVALLDIDADYTPAQVAQRLRMSRTHPYKPLDSGRIPSHRVGRDRRIAGRDAVAFERHRQEERRALAERFAGAQTIRRGAVDGLAAEL